MAAEVGGEIWDRFTVHYTPTHGSWLNQAEIEIGIFSRQCLGTRRIPDLKTLRREARAWNRRMNRARTKINWKFDRKTARRKFGYKKNLSRGHRPSAKHRMPNTGHHNYGRPYGSLPGESDVVTIMQRLRRPLESPMSVLRPI